MSDTQPQAAIDSLASTPPVKNTRTRITKTPENAQPITIHPSPPAKTLKLSNTVRTTKPRDYYDERLSRVPIKYTNPKFKSRKSPDRRKKSRSRSPPRRRRTRSPDKHRYRQKSPKKSRRRRSPTPKRSPKRHSSHRHDEALSTIKPCSSRTVKMHKQVPLQITRRCDPAPTCSTPPPVGSGEPLEDIHAGTESTRNRIRGLLFKLKKTEEDRDTAKSESRGFKYKYDRMKAKAQEMATVNAGLIQSNSQLTSRVKLFESMQNPFNHPNYQNFGMMPGNAPLYAPATTFRQQMPRSSTIESIDIPNWVHE